MMPGPGDPLFSGVPARLRELARYASLEYGESAPYWLIQDHAPAATKAENVRNPSARRLTDGVVRMARAIGAFFF